MIRIGIIGTGSMANGHAANYGRQSGVKVVACCDVLDEKVKVFAEKHGIPRTYTDYVDMLDTEELDGVDIVTRDDMHVPIAMEVMKRKIPVFSEKPLATSLPEAKKAAKAAKASGVLNMVNFSWRNSASIQRVASIVQSGKIGRLMHVEASFLQSWLTQNYLKGDLRDPENHWTLWRLSTKHGSLGTLGDVGCHLYDAVEYICGDITTIQCQLKAFDKGVPGNKVGEYVLDANDSFVANVTFKNGALGSVHSSRWATGRGHEILMQIYGDEGAILLNLGTFHDSNEFKMIRGKKNIMKHEWETVTCKKPIVGTYKMFTNGIKQGTRPQPDFRHATRIQACLHASLESSKKKTPVKITV